MGTPDFAQESLCRLYSDGHNIAGVFTRPDKPKDRGMHVSGSPVKQLALEHGTPVFQPATLRDSEVIDILKELKCDLITVVAYGRMLPREVLEMPAFGCLNIHGSLLPKYRGAAPIQWAILNGETETGVTSMYISGELDEGDTLCYRKTTIGDDETAGELYDRLKVLGADLLSETIRGIINGTVERKPQNQAEATYAPPLKKEMAPIDWTKTAYSIKAKVRGLNPWPVATAVIKNTVCKVFAVEIREVNPVKTPGEIVSAGRHGLEVACIDGSVIIKELQAPGGRRMDAADYLRGHGYDWQRSGV